jgi:hypothetical protein
MLDVIRAKLVVRDNLLVATILTFPTPICWSRSALGNPSSALDLGGCLLGMAFTTTLFMVFSVHNTNYELKH